MAAYCRPCASSGVPGSGAGPKKASAAQREPMKFYEIPENRVVESGPGTGRIVLATAPDDQDLAILQGPFRFEKVIDRDAM